MQHQKNNELYNSIDIKDEISGVYCAKPKISFAQEPTLIFKECAKR